MSEHGTIRTLLERKRIIPMLLVALAATLLIGYQYTSTATAVSSANVATYNKWATVNECTYQIFVASTTYYARNCDTGVIDYSGSSITTVMESAMASSGIIMVKQGTYTVTTQIDIPSNTIIQGEGENTLFQGSGNIVIFKAGDGTYLGGPGTQYENVVIRDLQINMGGSTGNDVYGIWMHTVSDYRIENTHISNQGTSSVRGAAIAIDESSGGIIYNNLIHDTINGIAVRHGAIHNTISNNHVYGINNFDGITTFQSAGNHAIVGNVVHDNADNGILLDGSAAGRNPDTTVSGNTAYNNAHEGIESYSNWRAVITGNTVNDNGRRGISINAVGDGGFTVSGNEAYNNDEDGIHIFQSRFGTVSGNTIRENGGNGINSSSTNTNTNYVGNNIYLNDKNGISIDSTAFVTVSGNNLRDNGQATTNTYDEITLVNTASNNIVSDNVIRINAANKARYGIAEQASGDNNNLITDNLITGAATANGLINGAASIWSNNKGFATEAEGTGTINNAATTATVTHGLAYTPSAGEITITFTEDPTNTPGAVFITSISSTQFTVNVENDPGASNLDFSWSVARIG